MEDYAYWNSQARDSDGALDEQRPYREPNAMRPGSRTKSLDSGFYGSDAGYAGRSLLIAVLTVASLGLYAPWGICMMRRWEADHTIVSGRKLRFTGMGEEMFISWLLWTAPAYLLIGILFVAALFAPNILTPVCAFVFPAVVVYPTWLRIRTRRWTAWHTFIDR